MLGNADIIDDGSRVGSRRSEVLELVAKRRSLKQVANELGISESTVNYHIRNLKELHGVNSLAQLADVHGLRQGLHTQADYRKSPSRESAVHVSTLFLEGSIPDNGEPMITFQDAIDFKFDAPWTVESEPHVVPGVLEGANSGLFRMAAIVAIAVGMLCLVLLGLGVAQGISAAMSGVGASPAQTF